MEIAVIIINWNGATLLEDCLNHLMRQTLQPKWIYVVDNASSDNSISIIEQFESVSLLKMTTNMGFAAANNKAIAEFKGEFIALLNPDAYPEPEWLENLIRAAENFPDVAAFGSRQLSQSDDHKLDGIGDEYHITGLVWRDRFGATQNSNDLIPREIFSPCAAAALYRRDVFVSLGGFDEDFFCYVEDIDLGFRLRLAGYKARYVPDAVVRHVGSATTGGQHSDFSIYHGHRNLVWTFVKNMPGYLFWLLVTLHIVLNLFSIIWFAMHGKGMVILQAKRDALFGLPEIWKKRKVIQDSRVVEIAAIWKVLDKRLYKIKDR